MTSSPHPAVLCLILLPHLIAFAITDDTKPAYASFIAALRTVETGGQPNQGRDALGDGGRSLGPFQISRAYWTDARMPGRYEDVRDAAYAVRTMEAYWARYCPDSLAGLDFETLARVHNGGPKGHRKEATKDYWLKVQRAMSR